MTELNLSFTFFAIAAFVFGLIIGSFLNVVIHRVPMDESIVFPGSRCTGCGASIRPLDNIPILSFLLLRGRCRNCRQKFSWRYPAVELLTAVIFTLILLKTGPTWETLLEMIFAAIMISLVFIDAIHHLLPNVITYPAIVFALTSAAARAGWGTPASYSFDISLIFVAEKTGFQSNRAAVIGGLLLALAAPVFWLLDRLDLILYNKYFEWEEMNEEENAAVKTADNDFQPASIVQTGLAAQSGEADSTNSADSDSIDADRRYQRTIRLSVLFGLLIATVWAVLCLIVSDKDPQSFDLAYGGLWRAVAGALVGSVPVWWLRAAYFYIRGAEGMGLGDVKLMAIIGAFMGWQGAFGVLLLGSISGSVIGAFMMWRSKAGLKTALPFGVCLGATALLILLMPLFK